MFRELSQKLPNIHTQYVTFESIISITTLVFGELSQKLPNVQSALMLGEAYMTIQEPEKAVEVFEETLKRNPKVKLLASKIGQALIKAHNYNKVRTAEAFRKVRKAMYLAQK